MIDSHIPACSGPWPELIYDNWKDTLKTVHQWTQIVGKIRLRTMPWQNHSWHTSLYISTRGLSTGSIPYHNGVFDITFDFENHKLLITSTFFKDKTLDLYSRSVASFYNELFSLLEEIGMDIEIYPRPNELPDNTPFFDNEKDCTYDEQAMVNYWQIAVNTYNIFSIFRSDFIGKCSPVHFFWGAFDIAVTRFSGRLAPEHPGIAPNMSKEVMKEAYSQEVSSAGFWPGSDDFPKPVYYSYCYPTPKDFGAQNVFPNEAFYSDDMGEYFLPYENVRESKDPSKMLLDFLQTTYDAAANTGNWNRSQLEK
ncbi:DUF5996 family protein [Marinigracilibium pacificum]|uniref:Ava_C0101 and related proteins n=1 Tax=Marinigracilibium pacificum TaxID=2729599 RepID=A0A848IUJ3_9BACT|nr:DUF5996 family protein [Marinigracilibium pacificum]NMM47376.1 hypothetical protein [Marinigracilibium pacificum]